MQVYKWHHTASWDTLGSKPPEFSGGFAERAIWRRTLSAPLFGSLRTTKYAPHRKRGAFAFCIQISRSANQFCVGRMTASKPPSWMLTYVIVRSASRRGLFLLSDAEISPSVLTAPFGDLLCQSPIPQCGHVRLSTLPFAEGAFSRISSKWRRQAMNSASGRL